MKTSFFPTLDIVIPCYQASGTLERAVTSCLQQNNYQHIILVDDGSTDNTWQIMQRLKAEHSHIITLKMPENSGVACARNWGTLHSQAELVAFLDADDAYQKGALDSIAEVFHHLPELSLIRLKFIPINLSPLFSEHPNFPIAWETLQMTGAGNTIFSRNTLLACGGFPQDELFKRLGGEDGALGIAFEKTAMIGTLFEEKYQGVQLYCREGMHAERLLRAVLFDEHYPLINEDAIIYANNVTNVIVKRLKQCQIALQSKIKGRTSISITYGKPNK
ncbi:glycosyltransferase family 2 protein [Phocoenobacter skyensis]|uniref:Glycosyl transferase family 2 n=1 Tax=Phocoenobacter skyensis TaxID=97481 RepID=A0A1H7V048_9PAST|nr:glycosyltransferase family A protein [Pasteurella skyensis]MDP8078501.1 glycosyltransferase family A protein [Pasteurella skyensis]MDP8084407.1 glycosyltransferase family A protein [Pasteurella skyensis]MDP8170394.1 glycosyltransferase family A protein [Pasteurella skyensis]MDP8175071.1 glycosyltransferase family A protein [Pasteurella skyensis]MDP8184738.1 glycosyltransferase family A protein [Pasteurella skyensis]